MLMDFNSIVSNFAASQLKAIALCDTLEIVRVPAPKCPSYGCDATLGTDSGIIDGDRYCADCVANEAEVAGREERKRNAELFAIGHGDL